MPAKTRIWNKQQQFERSTMNERQQFERSTKSSKRWVYHGINTMLNSKIILEESVIPISRGMRRKSMRLHIASGIVKCSIWSDLPGKDCNPQYALPE
ncbi:uncharacterized protein J3R85_005454 [Psidium guajava]|nr:uncharacterized protein J3R85_005454 [Psidium guajava]